MEYADRNSKSKRINWTAPDATDNSGDQPKLQHVGKNPGDLFEEGIHSVKYIFSDDSGNVAECKFDVTVSGKCPGGGGGGYSPKFRIGVCRERSQILTLSKDKENENLYPF